ncbi:MAG: hypothetical protein C0518_16160 [Opitutus sp.]|nr:hypothetical protein [Opitutus sp.]
MNSTGATTAAAVEVRNLTKDFVTDWRGTRSRALDGVAFSVARGSVCVLVGPNGSGKTTLLKICAGLTRATDGSCAIAGQAPCAAGRAGRIGFAADDTVMPNYLTARSALTKLAQVAGLDVERIPGAVASALDQTGASAHADRKWRELSRGQRQRVALAQALLGEPEVLLLDEPAAGLDPRALGQFVSLVRVQRAAGRTVLFSSHFLPQVEELADQFVLLESGRVLFDGGRTALAGRGGLNAVYLEAVRP